MDTIRQIRSKIGKDSNEKGKLFEERFCAYMKSDLKYRNARTRGDFASKVNSKGTQVDVIGERSSKLGLVFGIMCAIYLVGCLPLFYMSYINDDYGYLVAGFVTEAGGIVMLIFSYTSNVEHTWVECKNKQEKATLDEVRTMFNRLNDYKGTKRKEFLFTKSIFVSSSGFIDDAYHFAKSKGIDCYIEKDGKFVYGNYWNI